MIEIATAKSELSDVFERVEAGRRLSGEDGLRIYASNDIHTIGQMANLVRRRRHERDAYYNVNRHINYTNFCVLRCKFCSFYRPYNKGRKDGYELTLEEIVARAKEAYDAGATEVHIVGGLHPTLPFAYYLDMCRGISQACPGMHIKAFTAIEIIHFTRIAKPRLSIAEVLSQLRLAGLGSLPGGGAEIFDDRVHAEAFQTKVGHAAWCDIHRTAHELGMFSNATMLYGHIETPAERINHLLKLREHQDKSLADCSAHFNCVVPLSFVPEGSEFAHLAGPTGLDDLKTLAISRLMLDNFPHVKAFWIMHSRKLAQLSLDWGVDDIDGTVVYYDITKRRAPDSTHQEMTVNQIKRLITQAGYVPVERDSLYRKK